MITTLLLTSLLSTSLQAQDEAVFSRTYKVGDKSTYSLKFGDAHGMISGTEVLTVQQLLDGGRAEVRAHLDDLQAKIEGGQAPPVTATDIVTKTVAHNMPEKFDAVEGNFNIICFFAMASSATLDKKVKAGTEESWTWTGGEFAVKGTTKVLELSLATKRLKAEIKVTATVKGTNPLEMTFTSTFDLADGSLIESHGKMAPPGHESEAMNFDAVRKP